MGLKGNVQASRVWKEDIGNLDYQSVASLCPGFFLRVKKAKNAAKIIK
jgi:hypothetical protein